MCEGAVIHAVTKTSPQICSAIKFREDEQKIYWRVRTADGGTHHVSFYWGVLLTKWLEKFLKWINDPTINNRKKICRLVALPKLPKDKLRDSDFLKNEIFKRLKFRQLHGRECFKPTRLTPEKVAEIAAVVNEGFVFIKEAIAKERKGSIKIANDLRIIGGNWEMLTRHRRFFMRDYLKFQSSLPGNKTANFWRLALSVWRNNPEPIKDGNLARKICGVLRACQ